MRLRDDALRAILGVLAGISCQITTDGTRVEFDHPTGLMTAADRLIAAGLDVSADGLHVLILPADWQDTITKGETA